MASIIIIWRIITAQTILFVVNKARIKKNSNTLCINLGFIFIVLNG